MSEQHTFDTFTYIHRNTHNQKRKKNESEEIMNVCIHYFSLLSPFFIRWSKGDQSIRLLLPLNHFVYVL